MVRGQADYGALAAKETTASVSDMGEIAARLGSIVTYDKRGDVVDFDSFEEPVLRWNIGISKGTDYIRLQSDNVYSGSQAVKLYIDGGTTDSAQIFKSIPVLASKRLGIEISFSQLNPSTNLRVILRYYDGSIRHYADIKYKSEDEKLYVRDSTHSYIEIADIGALLPSIFTFHTLKFVFDLDTNKYVRAMFNQNQYDISTIALAADSDDTAPQVEIMIICQNWDDSGGSGIIDNFVLTQEEP